MLVMPVAPPRDSMERYSEPRSPPDQKLSSNFAASARERPMTMRLRKMIAHDDIDAASSRIITNCTTGLASSTSFTIDICPSIRQTSRELKPGRGGA